MPNWTSNRLRIQTDSQNEKEFEKIAKLKEIFESDNPFGKIIPEPDWSKIPNEFLILCRFFLESTPL